MWTDLCEAVWMEAERFIETKRLECIKCVQRFGAALRWKEAGAGADFHAQGEELALARLESYLGGGVEEVDGRCLFRFLHVERPTPPLSRSHVEGMKTAIWFEDLPPEAKRHYDTLMQIHKDSEAFEKLVPNVVNFLNNRFRTHHRVRLVTYGVNPRFPFLYILPCVFDPTRHGDAPAKASDHWLYDLWKQRSTLSGCCAQSFVSFLPKPDDESTLDDLQQLLPEDLTALVRRALSIRPMRDFLAQGKRSNARLALSRRSPNNQ